MQGLGLVIDVAHYVICFMSPVSFIRPSEYDAINLSEANHRTRTKASLHDGVVPEMKNIMDVQVP